jgi:hypothetical protein
MLFFTTSHLHARLEMAEGLRDQLRKKSIQNPSNQFRKILIAR